MEYSIEKNLTNFDETRLKCMIESQLDFLGNYFRVDEYDKELIFSFYNEENRISEAVDNEITVNIRKDINSKLRKEFVNIVIRHELTHLLTLKWGYPIPLFFEGTAIYYADNKIREKRMGYNYQNLCRSFLENDVLIPLEDYILPRKFYYNQTDFRILLEAGSFWGFITDRFGFDRAKRIYTDYEPPTIDNPVIRINPVLESIFGKNLSDLENIWKNYLKSEAEEISEVTEKYSKEYFENTDFGHALIHCNICHHPIKKGQKKCPDCGAYRKIGIKVV